MTPTEGELIQIESQAEFMAMSFGTKEWRLMAEAVKELRRLRKNEFICTKCGLRKNGEQPALVEF